MTPYLTVPLFVIEITMIQIITMIMIMGIIMIILDERGGNKIIRIILRKRRWEQDNHDNQTN